MSRDKLRRVLVLLHAEADRPGSCSREVLATLRTLAALYERDCAGPPATEAGLLRALERMHAAPADAWTVAALARLAGMSRAVFARKFAATFGAPPLRHLHEERMERAAAHLAESDETLATVARRFGYRSEWAFGRAFKRHHGVAPGVYRRRMAVLRVGGSRPQMALAA